MTNTIAERVIDFLGSVQGMDRLQSMIAGPGEAVIDLNTAAVISADPDYPDGEMLIYERASGAKSRVYTHKLIEQIFVRHAYEQSVTEGGSVEENYRHISDHFYIKTDFGK